MTAYQAKLIRADAVEIRGRHRQGTSVIELAGEYRVWPSSITGILPGRSYPETITVPCPDAVREALERAAESDGVTAEAVATRRIANTPRRVTR